MYVCACMYIHVHACTCMYDAYTRVRVYDVENNDSIGKTLLILFGVVEPCLAFQVLRGCLRETLFDWPEGGADAAAEATEVAPMKKMETLLYGTDDVTYINSE